MHTPMNEMDMTQPPSQAPVNKGSASYLNQLVMRKLQKALEADPEANLESLIPSTYVI